LMALISLDARSAAAQRALDAMQAVPFTVLGITRGDIASMYFGLSALVGLLSIGCGVVNLLACRLAPEAVSRSTAMLWTNLTMATGALLLAVAAFPIPPIVLLSLAVFAYASGLLAARRQTA
ncbi:MAG TPA: hypothetical protein VFH02_13610, partial [Jiangellaceae bacterium]|nr:hypothetical protein [Jiangellaceae bacterium]